MSHAISEPPYVWDSDVSQAMSYSLSYSFRALAASASKSPVKLSTAASRSEHALLNTAPDAVRRHGLAMDGEVGGCVGLVCVCV